MNCFGWFAWRLFDGRGVLLVSQPADELLEASGVQTVLTEAEIGIFGRAPELATYFNCSPFISAA